MPDPKRKCRDFERTWRGYCVDKNLEDSWLERLNRLSTLSLINICEGHLAPTKGISTRHPHIYLKLKETYLRKIMKVWDSFRPLFLQEVDQQFQQGDSLFNFEMKFKLRAGPGRLIYQEDLTFKLRSNKIKETEEMDSGTRTWFTKSLLRIETLDSVIHEYLNLEIDRS